MNDDEARRIVTLVCVAKNREAVPGENRMWSALFRNESYEVMERAVMQALRTPGFFDTGHVAAQLPAINREVERQVRSARARGLVAQDWPLNRPVPEGAMRRMQAEWAIERKAEAENELAIREARKALEPDFLPQLKQIEEGK